MAKRNIKRAKHKAANKRTDLTGYPEIDEFLKACFEYPIDKDDELYQNMKTVSAAVGNAKLVLILTHLTKKLFEYDNFYNLLMDDVETNLVQFDRMKKMNVLGDEPEIQKAHKSMMVMSARLDEFARQMEEMSGQKLRKKTKPMEPVNVTKAAEELAGG